MPKGGGHRAKGLVQRIPAYAKDYLDLIIEHEDKKYSPEPWCAAFLAKLSKVGVITAAAEAADRSRNAVYKYAENHPWFKEAWGDALEEGIDRMENEAMRRAMVGFEEAIYHNGVVVGQRRRFSDTLLIFMLKASRPDKFRERVDIAHDFSGAMPGLKLTVEGEEAYRERRIGSGRIALPTGKGSSESSS